MSGSIIKIRRRSSTGQAGAPASLYAGELAFNENASDKTLYYGYGDNGQGDATSIISIGGEGAYVTLSTAQTVSGNKTFTGTVTLTGATVSLRSNQITENGSLFYTDARSRAAISGNASTGLNYNSSTGVALLSGIPNASLANSAITINGNSVSLGSTTTIASAFTISDGTTSTTISGGTVTLQGTGNELTVGNSNGTFTFGLPDNVTIASGLTVGGNLTVNGTVTTVNSTTVSVDDKNLELGATASPTDSTADGGGLTLKGASDKTITWLNATGAWTFNQPINVTNGGLRINGTEIVSSSRVLSNVTLSGITIDGGEF